MAEKYASTAKVIDGVLILSLPDAMTPVVWQMELGQSKSSALEIRTNTEGHFSLVLKTPRQDVLDIATYGNRDLAIKSLLVVSQAMEKAQGQLKHAPNTYPVPAISYSSQYGTIMPMLKKALKFSAILFGGVVLCALALLILSKVFLGNSTQTASIASGNSPVSADEFFESR
jgi:hypothetical protein